VFRNRQSRLGNYFPVPDSATVCEPDCALSVTFNVADRKPLAAGLSPTLIVQLLPAASELPQFGRRWDDAKRRKQLGLPRGDHRVRRQYSHGLRRQHDLGTCANNSHAYVMRVRSDTARMAAISANEKPQKNF
jgi:hypothetical protein